MSEAPQYGVLDAEVLPPETMIERGVLGPDITFLPALSRQETHVTPTGYHLLIEIPERSEVTYSGIYRPEEYRLKEQVASVLAYVVEIGSEAFKDKNRFPNQKPWCREGDFILIHPYTGSRFQIRDEVTGKAIEFRILEDRHVLAVVSEQGVRRVDRVNAA